MEVIILSKKENKEVKEVKKTSFIKEELSWFLPALGAAVVGAFALLGFLNWMGWC